MVHYDKKKAHLKSLPWFLLLFLFPFHWTLLNLVGMCHSTLGRDWNRWIRRSGYSINSPSINPQLLFWQNIWANWINSTDRIWEKDISLTENNVFFINNWPSLSTWLLYWEGVIKRCGCTRKVHDDQIFNLCCFVDILLQWWSFCHYENCLHFQKACCLMQEK